MSSRPPHFRGRRRCFYRRRVQFVVIVHSFAPIAVQVDIETCSQRRPSVFVGTAGDASGRVASIYLPSEKRRRTPPISILDMRGRVFNILGSV